MQTDIVLTSLCEEASFHYLRKSLTKVCLTGVPDFVDKLHSAAMQQHKWRQNPRDEDSKYEDSEKDSDQVPM